MIPHWDLYPDEPVILVRPTGKEEPAVFRFRDTAHACFTFDSDGKRHYLQLADNGKLWNDPPFDSDGYPIQWRIQGHRESTRTETTPPKRKGAHA